MRNGGRWGKREEEKESETGASIEGGRREMLCVYMALLCLHYLRALINLCLKQTKSIVNTHKAFQAL